jgi:hypothetical protein
MAEDTQELEGGLYTLGEARERAAQGLAPWIITTSAGCRVWWAETERHAKEQHHEALPEESVVSAVLGAAARATITRERLAEALEGEAHNELAERIRAGSNPADVLGDGHGGLRKALRRSRYDDQRSRAARELFTSAACGALALTTD